jgi:hypothetical protein
MHYSIAWVMNTIERYGGAPPPYGQMWETVTNVFNVFLNTSVIMIISAPVHAPHSVHVKAEKIAGPKFTSMGVFTP